MSASCQSNFLDAGNGARREAVRVNRVINRVGQATHFRIIAIYLINLLSARRQYRFSYGKRRMFKSQVGSTCDGVILRRNRSVAVKFLAQGLAFL